MSYLELVVARKMKMERVKELDLHFFLIFPIISWVGKKSKEVGKTILFIHSPVAHFYLLK